jgi:hypothetical protein
MLAKIGGDGLDRVFRGFGTDNIGALLRERGCKELKQRLAVAARPCRDRAARVTPEPIRHRFSARAIRGTHTESGANTQEHGGAVQNLSHRGPLLILCR